jgi:hypothetical protein
MSLSCDMDPSREALARNAFKREPSKHRAKPLPVIKDPGRVTAIEGGVKELASIVRALEERISALPILTADELKATRKLLRDLGRIERGK